MVQDAEMVEKLALEAAQRGDFAQSEQLFERVARAHLAARADPNAFRALSNLAMVRKLRGDRQGGLSAIEEALVLRVAVEERRIALMTRGSLLDGLDDQRAVAAWTEASAAHTDPATIAFCRAHAVGASLKHGDASAFEVTRRVLVGAKSASPAQVVGIVGAVGESAGPAGVPLLAQANLMMLADFRTFTPATAAFWELLVDRLDPTTPLVLLLTAFGMLIAALRQHTPDHGVLTSRSQAVTRRIAHARGVSAQDLVRAAVDRISTPDGDVHGSVLMPVLEPALRALVPADQWLVPPRDRPPITA